MPVGYSRRGLSDERAEHGHERGERDLRRAGGAYLHVVEHLIYGGDDGWGGADEAEAVSRDAVGLREGEEVDEGRAPVPVRGQIAVGPGNAACGGGEKTMGNPGGDEIAVRFVQDKCDIVLSSQFGKGGDETRGIYGTRLGMGSTEMAISWHARKTYRVVRGDQNNSFGLRSD